MSVTSLLPISVWGRPDRALSIAPWPRRTDLIRDRPWSGLLEWGADGAEPEVALAQAEPRLLTEFLNLPIAEPREAEKFAQRVGPLLYCEACPRRIHPPRLGPLSTTLTAVQARAIRERGPRLHRERRSEVTLLATAMNAARRLAKKLEEGDGNGLGSEDDWKSVLPGRWRVEPPKDAEWRAVGETYKTNEDQAGLLAGVLSGWLVGAHVIPQLARTSEGFSLVLTTSGLLGVLVAELALAVGGGIQHLGERCDGDCGRLVQVRRRGLRILCRACSDKERKRRQRARDKKQEEVADGPKR